MNAGLSAGYDGCSSIAVVRSFMFKHLTVISCSDSLGSACRQLSVGCYKQPNCGSALIPPLNLFDRLGGRFHKLAPGYLIGAEHEACFGEAAAHRTGHTQCCSQDRLQPGRGHRIHPHFCSAISDAFPAKAAPAVEVTTRPTVVIIAGPAIRSGVSPTVSATTRLTQRCITFIHPRAHHP